MCSRKCLSIVIPDGSRGALARRREPIRDPSTPASQTRPCGGTGVAGLGGEGGWGGGEGGGLGASGGGGRDWHGLIGNASGAGHASFIGVPALAELTIASNTSTPCTTSSNGTG